jgi:PAS domain S-box-containing protein
MSIERPPRDEASVESARLHALRALGVLDGPSNDTLDALVRAASAACEAPIALVSLVDARRQWFWANVGLDVRETPREVAFCDHAIRGHQVFVVPDAAEDPRFRANPLVTGAPEIRFYAGAPLVTQAGHALGTLCVIDRRPRTLTPTQQTLLAELSRAAMRLIEAQVRERAAADQETRLTLAAEVGGLGYWELERATQSVTWSDQIYRIHGLDPAAGMPDLDAAIEAYHPDDRPHVAACVARALEHGEPFSFDLRIVRPTGETRYVQSVGRARRAPNGDIVGVFGVFIDVTERELMRKRFLRNERLMTTGTLAAGVGHEINNPLTYTQANLDMALDEVRAVSGGSPSARMRGLHELLTEARTGTERIRKIVRGLRAFARDDGAPNPTKLQDVVDISINMAMHELRRVTLDVQLDDVPPILADESRLSQALVNLLVNAAQAFPSADPATNHVWVRLHRVGSEVVLSVRDDGPGIPAHVRPRIFDAFFTTKPVGQGTGLGLAISQSAVHALGGELRCETRPGVGTTFSIHLPLELVREQAPPERPVEPPRGRRGRVLIVDDEPGIVRTAARILKREHEVVACGDPKEALARLLGGERFDVVFCDMMMPTVSGMELYARVAGAHPEQAARFVFMTGALADDQNRDFLDAHHVECIEKPFTTHAVLAMTRRLVGA